MDGRTDTRSLLERLEGKFERKGANECWPWTAASDNHGRGRITVRGVVKVAAQVILEAYDQPRPEAPNDQALHQPDCLPSCSNPAHLHWGSQYENMQDKVIRGTSRHKPGTFLGSKSNLTEQNIRDIRASPLSHKELAKLYKISARSIWDIVKKRSWQFVE